MQVTAVPAFDDNYIWLIGEADCASVVVVDPGDETPVLEWLQQHDMQLGGILVTHHHYDHTGGIPELIQAYPETPVFGPAKAQIKGLNHRMREGDLLSLPGLDLRFSVMEVPGHTATHLAYLAENRLFCGDTLFAGGCGRVFDGTFEQLAASLQRIAGLAPETLIYCAHEYTLANLGFAAWVEPDNPVITQRLQVETAKREAGEPTVPSLLSEEMATNPFLRTAVPSVIAAAERYAGHPLNDQTAVFTVLRQWKDREYDK